MRRIIVSILIFFNIGILSSQPVFRAVEGGRVAVSIDTITSLGDLVSNLESNWEFVPTGKSYWIGYTDDMYSIALYGNEAIPYLSLLTKESNPFHARLGAIYTLHLIGINSKIAGRTFEEFIDTNARIEILKYLQDTNLHKTVVELLMRDPWTLDIKYYMDYLTLTNVEHSYVLSALKRYEFADKPLGQELPDSLLIKKITVRTNDSLGLSEGNMILALKESMPHRVEISKSVLEYSGLAEKDGLEKQILTKSEEISIDMILYMLDWSGLGRLYCQFDSRYFYSYSNGRLSIVGPIEAREIWLNWWNK